MFDEACLVAVEGENQQREEKEKAQKAKEKREKQFQKDMAETFAEDDT
ncbi:hypothetical protein GWP40_08680 [Treponema vincentii]|nr:hypothetical protein [Treponema vincentii]QUY18382.1 hypothetical protein GWP40_08680 [Treponema vincentii]